MSLTETIFNPVLNPILQLLGPFWALLVISFVLSLIATIVYKYATNQSEMKRLREDMKEHQKKMRESKDNPDALIDLQKQAMSAQMQYMKQSLRPTLITFLPIILVFGWLSAHLAFAPIMVGDTFNVTVAMDPAAIGAVRLVVPDGLDVTDAQKNASANVLFTVDAKKEGNYFIDVEHDGKIYSKDVIVTDEQRYAEPAKTYDGSVKSITLGYQKLIVLPIGFRNWFGWLGVYILFSIVFSMGLKKLFKLH
ncbi:MAG TPA: EMC3/TMCO1 family protein [Candidatus Nanoarchaeia archaeon]|nr:EMC3/TMCO1 family protein [Candidatus Nanoarchaeia archaeon]